MRIFCSGRKRAKKARTYLVKVVLVELADKGGKVGVLEHAGEDGLGKLVHVLDDEAIAVGAPCDDVGERRVLEHPAGRRDQRVRWNTDGIRTCRAS